VPIKNITNYTFYFEDKKIILSLVLIEEKTFFCLVPSISHQYKIEEVIRSTGLTYPLSHVTKIDLLNKLTLSRNRICDYRKTVSNISAVMFLMALLSIIESGYIWYFLFRVNDIAVALNNILVVTIFWLLAGASKTFLRNAAIQSGLRCSSCKQIATSNQGLDVSVIASKAQCCPYCGEDLSELYEPTDSKRLNSTVLPNDYF
jgi:hypothetical protein